MTTQIVLRRQPILLTKQSPLSTASKTVTFAEVAGGTAAECAVICCCCPFGIVNLAVLALYTLPAGICRRILRKKQRQQQRLLKGPVPRTRRMSCSCGCEGDDRQVFPIGLVAENMDEEKKELMRLEKEKWDVFYSTGFWRSPSQRENWHT